MFAAGLNLMLVQCACSGAAPRTECTPTPCNVRCITRVHVLPPTPRKTALTTARRVQNVDVPVIGGHAGITILPLFSQATGYDTVALSDADIKALTVRTQDGGTEVVQAKAGKGSATLSMAYAAAIFGDACMRGMSGEKPTECTYVQTDIVKGLSYFSTPVELGPNGVEKVLGTGPLNKFEEEGLENLKAELKSSIQAGLDFVKANPV
jgi:malate dehydrogenase